MEKLSIAEMSREISGFDWGLAGCAGALIGTAGCFAAFIAASGGTALAFFSTCSTTLFSTIVTGLNCGTYLEGIISEKR